MAVARVISSKKVYLYSEFGDIATNKMGFEKLDDIQSYLNNRIKKDNKIKITAIPNGRFVKAKDQ